jgi:hypothetical protein
MGQVIFGHRFANGNRIPGRGMTQCCSAETMVQNAAATLAEGASLPMLRPAPHQSGKAVFNFLGADRLANYSRTGIARVDTLFAIRGHEHEWYFQRSEPVDGRINGLPMPQMNVEESEIAGCSLDQAQQLRNAARRSHDLATDVANQFFDFQRQQELIFGNEHHRCRARRARIVHIRPFARVLLNPLMGNLVSSKETISAGLARPCGRRSWTRPSISGSWATEARRKQIPTLDAARLNKTAGSRACARLRQALRFGVGHEFPKPKGAVTADPQSKPCRAHHSVSHGTHKDA